MLQLMMGWLFLGDTSLPGSYENLPFAPRSTSFVIFKRAVKTPSSNRGHVFSLISLGEFELATGARWNDAEDHCARPPGSSRVCWDALRDRRCWLLCPFGVAGGCRRCAGPRSGKEPWLTPCVSSLIRFYFRSIRGQICGQARLGSAGNVGKS